MSGRRIVMIEDSKAASTVLKEVLEAEGYAVLHAADGVTGLALARREKPDLILLDLLLPDLPPEEAIRALRAVPCAAKTPIIAFTALDPLEIRRRRLDTEFSGVVTKPYEAGELVAKIKKILG